MTNHMTKPQQFDAAFMHVEPRDRGFANVTVGKVKLLVSTYYCPFCAWAGRVGDGAPWCSHKEAAFGHDQDDAADLYETYREALYS